MVKKAIRSVYLEKRLSLVRGQVLEQDKLLANHFSEISFPNFRVLLSYYPLVRQGEFDVRICEHILSEKNSELRLALPRISDDEINMEAFFIGHGTKFSTNRLSIPEPIDSPHVTPIDVDIVFVPLLAFDMFGFRVGYGKGYYDRYLSRCRKNVIKIGFSYFEPVSMIEDINEFDVPLSYCITPMRVYEF